jgi:hypothetical protein
VPHLKLINLKNDRYDAKLFLLNFTFTTGDTT